MRARIGVERLGNTAKRNGRSGVVSGGGLRSCDGWVGGPGCGTA
jgi:hypothetical protein